MKPVYVKKVFVESWTFFPSGKKNQKLWNMLFLQGFILTMIENTQKYRPAVHTLRLTNKQKNHEWLGFLIIYFAFSINIYICMYIMVGTTNKFFHTKKPFHTPIHPSTYLSLFQQMTLVTFFLLCTVYIL